MGDSVVNHRLCNHVQENTIGHSWLAGTDYYPFTFDPDGESRLKYLGDPYWASKRRQQIVFECTQ